LHVRQLSLFTQQKLVQTIIISNFWNYQQFDVQHREILMHCHNCQLFLKQKITLVSLVDHSPVILLMLVYSTVNTRSQIEIQDSHETGNNFVEKP